MDFKAKHNAYLALCETEIEKSCERILQPESIVSKAAMYSVLNGGKRVRGVLTLSVCDLLGGNTTTAAPFAAAIEMIHAFSLVHDDLPCMDDDDLRRGKPACHIAFGEANALLAGDALSIAAFEAVSCADIAPELAVKAVSILAAASGARGMIYGQELDMKYEQKTPTQEQLLEIHKNKTGALLAAAAKLGIVASGNNPNQCEEIVQYAQVIGLVFQIIDDILDVTAQQEQLGKPVGSDSRSEKTTFVSLHGLSGSREEALRLTSKATERLEDKYGAKADFLVEYANLLSQRVF